MRSVASTELTVALRRGRDRWSACCRPRPWSGCGAAVRHFDGRVSFSLLLSPFELRDRRLRNRIVSTPHATGWGGSTGRLERSEVDYQVRKAAGGCALVMTFGSASVDPTTAASYGSVALWDERNEPALRALAAGVHEHGGVCISQMTHMGRRGHSLESGIPLRAPSDVPEPVHREVPVPLDAEEIPPIVQRFAAAARRLEACGWDGCEVTSFGGHLIEQFFDPKVNTRSDAYGGTLENRTRFAGEVLEAVRAAVSERFIVGFRMTVDQRLEDGLTTAELREIAARLCATGHVDLLSVSGGTGATPLSQAATVPPDELPEAAYVELAGAIRAAVRVPVLVAGRILDGETAERCLRETGVDLVAMTRAIIADPDLPRRLEDRARSRPCISINEGCIGRLYSGLPMWCSVNPTIREPRLEAPAPAAEPGRVVVVGGGVAGLEAARVAASRGHQVLVLERRPVLGGRARLALERRGRQRWGLYLDWLAAELADAGAEVRVGIDADADAVLAERPDAVVLATGSVPRAEAVPPGPLPVLDADAVLEDGAPAPAHATGAVVLDDETGFVAPTVAETLAARGWQVEIVTALPGVATEIDPTQRPFVLRRLERARVRLNPNQECVRSEPAGVILRHVHAGDQTHRHGVGLIVIAGHRRAAPGPRAVLRERRPDLELHVVGDALAPRTLLDAVAEGARAGADVGARVSPPAAVPARS
jgi:2,4-dienoyl-CoA reductase-like NADH-dependent reductase (Old Yellow Enzyme family)